MEITMNGFHGFKKIVLEQKKYAIYYLLVMVFLGMGIMMVFHNYNWYDTTIAKIVSVENSFDHLAEGSKGETEKYDDQVLIGLIMNGKLQGNTITMYNEYSKSGVYDDEYKVGDEVFITVKTETNDHHIGYISGLKRDKYLAILFAALALLILMITSKKGTLVIISLLLNIIIFWYAMDLYMKGTDILFLSNAMVLFFTSISLLLVTGFKKKTFAAILSTLISIGLTMLIFKIVMVTTNGVDYAFMEYMVSPNDLPEIFMSQILLGGLGAIMDVAITMSSTMSELITKDTDISLSNLIKSGREVGYDIMGTMINVMLFTYLCGGIPLIIFKMKNDISFFTIILRHMPFELYRFLLGSIGILLSIPISLFISIIIFKKLRKTV